VRSAARKSGIRSPWSALTTTAVWTSAGHVRAGGVHLGDDLARGERAGQTERPGGAKAAGHRTSDLAGHAERKPVGAHRDEDRLDPRAVRQADHQLLRAVRVDVNLLDGGRGLAGGGRERAGMATETVDGVQRQQVAVQAADDAVGVALADAELFEQGGEAGAGQAQQIGGDGVHGAARITRNGLAGRTRGRRRDLWLLGIDRLRAGRARAMVPAEVSEHEYQRPASSVLCRR
jgi:hypothetical protein